MAIIEQPAPRSVLAIKLEIKATQARLLARPSAGTGDDPPADRASAAGAERLATKIRSLRTELREAEEHARAEDHPVRAARDEMARMAVPLALVRSKQRDGRRLSHADCGILQRLEFLRSIIRNAQTKSSMDRQREPERKERRREIAEIFRVAKISALNEIAQGQVGEVELAIPEAASGQEVYA